MATVTTNGNKYKNKYAIANTLDYYTDRSNSGTNWTYWTACGVDCNDIETAKNQMMRSMSNKVSYSDTKMHQVFVKISWDEMKHMNVNSGVEAEEILVGLIGRYFYSYGLQSISFVYRNRTGIFIRTIVNSISLRNGKAINRFTPFLKELEDKLNDFIY